MSIVSDAIWDDIQFRLDRPWIELEASGRHLHLSRSDADVLLGRGVQLTPVHNLSQPGQYTCAERIRVIGPKGEFPALGIIGPERTHSQVELSETDAMTLGIKAPVKLSGDHGGTPGITLVGPAGSVNLTSGVMVAKRHIHMHPDFGARFGLVDRQVVSVRVWGVRGVTFNDVSVRMSPDFDNYMHIDYDEANSCGFYKGMIGTIIAHDK